MALQAWSYQAIRTKYLANYITDEQLQRFVELGVITQAQHDELYAEKHGVTEEA